LRSANGFDPRPPDGICPVAAIPRQQVLNATGCRDGHVQSIGLTAGRKGAFEHRDVDPPGHGQREL